MVRGRGFRSRVNRSPIRVAMATIIANGRV
jgi:hypothetical protein